MKHTLAKGTLYLTISSLIFMISGYVINIWLGRQLGPEAYGVYGIIIALVTAINLTQTAGLPTAVAKYVAGNIDQAESIYKTGLILQTITTISLSFLLLCFSGVIASLLQDPALTPYLQVASLIFPLYGLFALVTGYYNGLHLFKKQALLHIIYSLLKIVFIIMLTILFHLYGVIIGFIASTACTLLAGLHIPKTTLTFPYKKLITFSLPLIGIAIFSNLLQSIDLFFVKALMKSHEAPGLYTAGQNISRIPFFALNALSVVLLPSISKSISKKNKKATKQLVRKALRIALLLCVPLVFFMSATSMQLIDLIYSSQYLPAAQSLSILLLGIGFLTIFTLVSNILSGAGNPRTPLVISLIGNIVTASLCLLLIPFLGLNGAALATTCGSFLAMILAVIMLYIKWQTGIPFKSSFKIFSAAFIAWLMTQLFIIPVLLLPLFYLFLFALYFGLLFLMKEIQQEDIMLVKAIIQIKNNETKR